MSPYEAQVREAVEATALQSPTSYSWRGTLSPRLPKRVTRALSPATARGYLLHALQAQLYTDFYVRGSTPAGGWDAGGSASDREPFLAALSAANAGSGFWQGDWEVRWTQNASVVVARMGLELWVGIADCLALESDSLTVGTRVCLRLPKDSVKLSPGFYMAFGDRELVDDASCPIVRYYWNLVPDGAVPFVAQATSTLNGAGLPFRLKVLADPRSFARCDAGVIYIRKEDRRAAAAALRSTYGAVAEYLKLLTPVFTRPLAQGLAFAEDPGEQESFGQQRCRLLADGIIRAHERGVTSLAERVAIVGERFDEARIRLDKPYLNPDSDDDETLDPVR